MNLSGLRIYLAAAVWAIAASCVAVANAQTRFDTAFSNNMMRGMHNNDVLSEQLLSQDSGNPMEKAAYVAFHKIAEYRSDEKLRLGDAFLEKYPTDRYSQAIYEEIAETCYSQKALARFYDYSDRGISLFPDDVYLLALTGWVIPHEFDVNASGARETLDKAESYEKHAIDLMGKMAKPQALTDAQFTEFKTEESVMAHSGLGLVYFRRKQFEISANELQQATSNAVRPDPTDFFVLGADLDNLGRFEEAADAFNRCARLGGSTRNNCKKLEADAVRRTGNSR